MYKREGRLKRKWFSRKQERKGNEATTRINREMYRGEYNSEENGVVKIPMRHNDIFGEGGLKGPHVRMTCFEFE